MKEWVTTRSEKIKNIVNSIKSVLYDALISVNKELNQKLLDTQQELHYYLYETTEKGNFNIMLAHSGVASTSIEDLEEALQWPYEAIQKKRMEDLDVF